MGDRSDASFELFGDQAVTDTIVGEFAELVHPETDATGTVSYVAPDLVYGGEDPICNVLRGHRVAYEFFQMGDYEYEPQIRLYHPDIAESFGYQAASGEWRGPASASGEPLLAVSAIDRILDDMPEDGDDVWLREQLEVASAARWRATFDQLRGRPAVRPNAPATSTRPVPSVEDVAVILARDSDFADVRPEHRYLVLFAMSYEHGADVTDLGDLVTSGRHAAHWALELTRDGSSAENVWHVFDAEPRAWTSFEQGEIEEA